MDDPLDSDDLFTPLAGDLEQPAWVRQIEERGIHAFAASDDAAWSLLRDAGATCLAMKVQRVRLEVMLLAGREDQALVEFASDEFLRDAAHHRQLAHVCVRALGVLMWREPERALEQLSQWAEFADPEVEELLLAIQSNAFLVDSWRELTRRRAAPASLSRLVKYANVVSVHAHAELLETVGADLRAHPEAYAELFDRMLPKRGVHGDRRELLAYIESLCFCGYSWSLPDDVHTLTDVDSDLCHALTDAAAASSRFSSLYGYSQCLSVAGVIFALCYVSNLDPWICGLCALTAGLLVQTTGVGQRERYAYYRSVVRPLLIRAFATHGCHDHELLRAWIEMHPGRVGPLGRFDHQYRSDTSLQLIGILAAGARHAQARPRD